MYAGFSYGSIPYAGLIGRIEKRGLIIPVLASRICEKLKQIDEIGEVSNVPALEFNSYPGAYCIMEESKSDYSTIKSDSYIYTFLVHLLSPTESDGTITEEAIDTLYELADLVLDIFEQDKQFQDDGDLNLPNGKYILNVTPRFIGWEQVTESNLLDAAIKIDIDATFIYA